MLTIALLLCGPSFGNTAAPVKVRVRGVELHYIERGQGQPLILLHGGQGDYSTWAPQMDAFSRRFRVISYSRRYNYPNDNPLTTNYRSALTEADDLAALIRKLRLGRVHLVGTSIGAFTALVLAVEHPELVRSLVLAEPPVLRWAKDDPAGRASYDQFIATMWTPAAKAFRSGDDEAAMRILVDGFATPGKFDGLPPEARAVALRNARYFKAATSSPDPFPKFSKEKVRRLRIPVLILTGEHTLEMHKFINTELARLLPAARTLTIPRAGHGSPRENPEAFNQAVLEFLP